MQFKLSERLNWKPRVLIKDELGNGVLTGSIDSYLGKTKCYWLVTNENSSLNLMVRLDDRNVKRITSSCGVLVQAASQMSHWRRWESTARLNFAQAWDSLVSQKFQHSNVMNVESFFWLSWILIPGGTSSAARVAWNSESCCPHLLAPLVPVYLHITKWCSCRRSFGFQSIEFWEAQVLNGQHSNLFDNAFPENFTWARKCNCCRSEIPNKSGRSSTANEDPSC